jgi:hypothetical protein
MYARVVGVFLADVPSPSGLTTTPGTPMLRSSDAVKFAASSSVNTSRSTLFSGE